MAHEPLWKLIVASSQSDLGIADHRNEARELLFSRVTSLANILQVVSELPFRSKSHIRLTILSEIPSSFQALELDASQRRTRFLGSVSCITDEMDKILNPDCLGRESPGFTVSNSFIQISINQDDDRNSQ